MGTLFSFQLRAFFIMSTERTFIACKPDAVQRGPVAKIIARFEDKGFKLVGLKMLVPTKEFAEKHYADLAGKPFFPGMIEYFTSGPELEEGGLNWQRTTEKWVHEKPL